ncbi:MAG: hypothetical protein ACI8PZ_005517 [Myxococcota bacterium]|jgi:hypothetical protein
MTPALAALAIQASTAELAWLAGCWRSTEAGVTTEECWIPPEGGMLLGTNRTLRDGRAVGFEFLRISEEDSHVIYWAAPGGRHPATPFVLTSKSKSEAVFSNPGHDFPQRLHYARDGSTLTVVVQAGDKKLEFRWTKKIE